MQGWHSHRENHADFCNPAVIVGVRPDSARDWTRVSDEITAALDAHSLFYVATINEMNMVHSLTDTRADISHDHRELDSIPGCSLGVRGSEKRIIHVRWLPGAEVSRP